MKAALQKKKTAQTNSVKNQKPFHSVYRVTHLLLCLWPFFFFLGKTKFLVEICWQNFTRLIQNTGVNFLWYLTKNF